MHSSEHQLLEACFGRSSMSRFLQHAKWPSQVDSPFQYRIIKQPGAFFGRNLVHITNNSARLVTSFKPGSSPPVDASQPIPSARFWISFRRNLERPGSLTREYVQFQRCRGISIIAGRRDGGSALRSRVLSSPPTNNHAVSSDQLSSIRLKIGTCSVL